MPSVYAVSTREGNLCFWSKEKLAVGCDCNYPLHLVHHKSDFQILLIDHNWGYSKLPLWLKKYALWPYFFTPHQYLMTLQPKRFGWMCFLYAVHGKQFLSEGHLPLKPNSGKIPTIRVLKVGTCGGCFCFVLVGVAKLSTSLGFTSALDTCIVYIVYVAGQQILHCSKVIGIFHTTLLDHKKTSIAILWRLFHSANPPATGWYTFSISGDTPPFIPSVDFISYNKFLKVSAWKGSEWERESWFINLKSRPHVWSHTFFGK